MSEYNEMKSNGTVIEFTANCNFVFCTTGENFDTGFFFSWRGVTRGRILAVAPEYSKPNSSGISRFFP